LVDLDICVNEKLNRCF